jgi:DNA-binding CsgD family transcriptional regulator
LAAVRHGDGLRPVRRAESDENAANMRLDRLPADRQLCGNLGVREALGGVRAAAGTPGAASRGRHRRLRKEESGHNHHQPDDGAPLDSPQCAHLRDAAGRSAALADRFGEPDLAALARHVQGRATLRRGDIAGGVALLDEAMLSVLTENISPVVLTVVYCGLIEGCQEIFDLHRAREWTTALTAWYAARPDAHLNRGRCLVHRAEVHLDNGDWPAALWDAQRACGHLTDQAGQPVLGAAHYVIGELHRLRGSAAAAEEEYQRAGLCGRDPQPGLALLRLAGGDVDAARTAVQRALAETPDRWNRPRLLAAHVEIALRAGDVPAATIAADELGAVAAEVDTPYLAAMAAQATGSVLLAGGEPGPALAPLRRAWTAWQSLQVPYETARCRVLHALACRELGDADGAQMQHAAARAGFSRLGAAVDAGLTPSMAKAAGAGALTARETQVLRLVAKGLPNRAIAEHLGLREKTIARHLSNIFTKLQVRSRAAATAYAYEHRLL